MIDPQELPSFIAGGGIRGVEVKLRKERIPTQGRFLSTQHLRLASCCSVVQPRLLGVIVSSPFGEGYVNSEQLRGNYSGLLFRASWLSRHCLFQPQEITLHNLTHRVQVTKTFFKAKTSNIEYSDPLDPSQLSNEHRNPASSCESPGSTAPCP